MQNPALAKNIEQDEERGMVHGEEGCVNRLEVLQELGTVRCRGKLEVAELKGDEVGKGE
jgi:hypothetical protein